jgi:hypothetical protein
LLFVALFALLARWILVSCVARTPDGQGQSQRPKFVARKFRQFDLRSRSARLRLLALTPLSARHRHRHRTIHKKFHNALQHSIRLSFVFIYRVYKSSLEQEVVVFSSVRSEPDSGICFRRFYTVERI